MASDFASVSEEETVKMNEEETPLNTKKTTKFGVSVFDGKFLFFSFSLVLAREMDGRRLVVKLVFSKFLNF